MKLTVLALLLLFHPELHAHICTTKVSTSEDNITFVDCNPVFEVCCEDGCCSRFSHAHIWLFTAAITFIICICGFGCWLLCCKNGRANRVVPPGNDRVDSPLTLVTADSRNGDIIRAENQTVVPTTPPPTYEEATAMR